MSGKSGGPPKFTPFKNENPSAQPTPEKNSGGTSKKHNKKTKKSKGKKGNDPTDKDKEINSLKAKIKKYEQELRRSDDTILVQEEEIKRLTKQLQENASTGKSTDGASEGTHSHSAISEGESEHKKTRHSKKKSTKRQGRVLNIDPNSYSLTHIKLRSGSYKDGFADLTLNITSPSGGGSSGSLMAHSAIVSVRCAKWDKALKDRYAGKKKKAKRKQLDLRGASIETISTLLNYLYSDEVPNLGKLSPLALLNLVIAARHYALDRLVWIVENQMLSAMTLDIVVPLLKGAHGLKEERVKTFCTDYLLLPDVFKDFVVRGDLTAALGMDLFSEVVKLNATGGKKPQGKPDGVNGHQIANIGKCPPSTIRQDFQELYKQMLYADAFVRLDNETIQFHKCVLASASKNIFDTMNKAKLTPGQLEDMSECLELGRDQKFYNKLSAEAFKSLLRFVYYGDVDMEALPACLLIPFVRVCGMKDLQELSEQVIQQSVSDSHVVLKIMAVTYLAIMRSREDMRAKLRQECIEHIASHLREVDFLEIKNMEREFALDLAVDLLSSLQKAFA